MLPDSNQGYEKTYRHGPQRIAREIHGMDNGEIKPFPWLVQFKY